MPDEHLTELLASSSDITVSILSSSVWNFWCFVTSGDLVFLCCMNAFLLLVLQTQMPWTGALKEVRNIWILAVYVIYSRVCPRIVYLLFNNMLIAPAKMCLLNFNHGIQDQLCNGVPSFDVNDKHLMQNFCTGAVILGSYLLSIPDKNTPNPRHI